MKNLRPLLALALLLGSGCLSRGDETAPSSDPFRVMSYNVLRGGTGRGQPLEQTAKVIRAGGADIVGLQEIGEKIEALAEILGWNHERHGSSGIVTRFEITARHENGVRIRLDSGREAEVFNVHLKPAPYQPYQLLEIPYGNGPFIKTGEEAIAAANAARGPQVEALLKNIAALPDAERPVFVTGDFNEPSHLDWTAKAAEQGIHPIAVVYPTSRALVGAGFIDAWRQRYPDEIARPGFTWTPLTKADDPKDHHDRIDFVYFRGEGIKPGAVKVIGEDEANADVVVTPYPSDHRAVMATFTIGGVSGRPGEKAEPSTE